MSKSDKHYIALALSIAFLACCAVTDLDAHDAAIAAEEQKVKAVTASPAAAPAPPQETPVMLDTPLTSEEVQALLDCCEREMNGRSAGTTFWTTSQVNFRLGGQAYENVH